jgi:two-component system sensor histidine kinase and response regulator WspE
VEKLEAPLTHLLRNAVDHGIELPEGAAGGQAGEGLIRLRASHQAGLLSLELIAMTARHRPGAPAQQHRRTRLSPPETRGANLSEELLTFLFLPGFSLRDKVTEVSGRGVGLDAVQHMVRQLRGSSS